MTAFPMLYRGVLVGMAMSAIPGQAYADDIFGNWLRGDGAAHVRIAPCGSSICATNNWIKDPSGQNEKVGDRLVFDISEKQSAWSGSAYDPQRKIKMSATLKANGDSMESQGCLLGGVLCKTTTWKRM